MIAIAADLTRSPCCELSCAVRISWNPFADLREISINVKLQALRIFTKHTHSELGKVILKVEVDELSYLFKRLPFNLHKAAAAAAAS
jgi:hypothetical protein